MEHVPLIGQSSIVTEPAHTSVVRRTQMAALLNWQQMRPMQNLKIICNFAVLMGLCQFTGQI